MDNTYTADSIRERLESKWDSYLVKLTLGRPETWVCDQRTKELFCLEAFLTDELISLGASEADRKQSLFFFNRKAGAEEDLFSLCALTLSNYLEGKVDKFAGRRKGSHA